MQVSAILETIIYADDLEAAEKFYTRVLGLKFVAREKDRFVFLQCGGRMFLLFNPQATGKQTHLPAHGAQGPQHVAFAVPAKDLNQWRTHLGSHGVEVEQEVEWESRGRSIYFRDPAGNSLELASPKIWSLPDLSN